MNLSKMTQLVREQTQCVERFNQTEVGQIFLGYDNEYWMRIQPLLQPGSMKAVDSILVQSSEKRRIGMGAKFGSD